jgi:hypothetical protein
LARTGPQTEELHKYIFANYVWQGRGQSTILKQIEDDSTLRQRFGGEFTPGLISYHVKQINEELENSVDFDAMDKFVGEYLRYQQSLDSEIGDLEEMIRLVDKEKKPELWLSLKRFKKDLLDARIKALADHELPLAVKKYKKERQTNKLGMFNLSKEDVPKMIEVSNGQESN